MRPLFASLLVFLVCFQTAEAQTGPVASERQLVVGEAIADSLNTGDVHSYTVEAGADHFVYGAVNQVTVDVVVAVHGPDGGLIGTFDRPARGAEPFQFETEDAGTYTIQVTPFEEETGAYSVRLMRLEPLADDPAARVGQYLAPYAGTDTPGAVVAFIRNGDIVFSDAYGMANLTHHVPFDVATRTNIGSTSKQFTALAILLLEDQGLLSLDDDVRTHIPELPDFGETVTLRHLLSHTSGYREFLNTLAMAGRRINESDFIDREEVIDVVRRQPALQNSPGAEWNYNNTGFGLLAEVVERVTGDDFAKWMAENVFEPLEMNDTVVRGHPRQIIENSAQGYTPIESGRWGEAADIPASAGAGGIYTTAADLVTWLRNVSTGAFGGRGIMDQMTTRYVLTSGDTTNYGLGLFVDEHRGLRRIHHGGADLAHRSMLAYYPEVDAGVLVMSNNATFDPNLADRVAEAFLEADMTPVVEGEVDVEAVDEPFDPADYEVEDFDELAGQYELDMAPGFVLRFWRDGDQLFTQATGQSAVDIVPTSDSTFSLTVVDASVTFHRDEEGVAQTLTLHQNGEHLARRIDGETWAPSEDELASFEGRFFSEELETYYTAVIEDGDLTLRHRRLDDIMLKPASEDSFTGSMPMMEVDFHRGEAGKVTAFSASNGRTRGVRFERVDAAGGVD